MRGKNVTISMVMLRLKKFNCDQDLESEISQRGSFKPNKELYKRLTNVDSYIS
jgi:hypothetical protein